MTHHKKPEISKRLARIEGHAAIIQITSNSYSAHDSLPNPAELKRNTL
jgi:hypothetical protein